jgi:GNAT superfamily N-acetyltransferase
MSHAGAAKIDFKRIEAAHQEELKTWIKRYYTYDHIAFDEKKVNHGLWALLGNDQFGTAYFVTLAGETIGYFILTYAFDIEFDGQHGVLTDLYLSEEARRSGAGTRTFQFIEGLCRDLNFTSLLLQVETDNLEAQSFYQKAGVKTLSRHILVKHLKDQA